ncbi:DUF1800 domain-containing protein [uncultured Tateyamaria sp.]|uniref:DUF1800 domain-containing protein n=1 Tax=uncultured Tateyamaria sp. TaxID=455651 RepID=UPI002611000C|nr:DUF1800 domain-containing protein [uncultured Tateyamaria sp.]
MRRFDPQLAEIRFGYGLSPVVAPPRSTAAMLDGLVGPDTVADRFPIETFVQFRARMVAVEEQRDIRKKNRGTDLAAAARKRRNELNKEARVDMFGWLGQTMLRRVYTETAFRERLVAFWADHFTAMGKRGLVRRATSPYIEDAIRPFVTGRFEDLLQAAVMHPLMLDYLDQRLSIGPNSVRAEKRGRNKPGGLNENLAREVLELHTLGVGGPYSQSDVTELAELFTGLTFDARNGFKFRKDFIEPGTETVLGVAYPDAHNASQARAALNDLAGHPSTARHLAWKLAVHFVSDDPDPDLVDALEAQYLDTGGALMALYETLLEHPAAWQMPSTNFKLPIDFVSSALRALAVPDTTFADQPEKAMRRMFAAPLIRMGQPWERPLGPDGWPEEDPEWITPQGIASRVSWAMTVPEQLMPALPDPRAFAQAALGGFADDTVRFAAAAAESKSEAIGIVLMSPAFQRR